MTKQILIATFFLAVGISSAQQFGNQTQNQGGFQRGSLLNQTNQQVGVPQQQQQALNNQRKANDLKAFYQGNALQAQQQYQRCLQQQQLKPNPNPYACQQYQNIANYDNQMAGSIRVPASNDFNGQFTNQPLPATGSTNGLPTGVMGRVMAGTVHGVMTGNMGQNFNTNYNTLPTVPATNTNFQNQVNNNQGAGAWQSYGSSGYGQGNFGSRRRN